MPIESLLAIDLRYLQKIKINLKTLLCPLLWILCFVLARPVLVHEEEGLFSSAQAKLYERSLLDLMATFKGYFRPFCVE